jgi:hypothetical protein
MKYALIIKRRKFCREYANQIQGAIVGLLQDVTNFSAEFFNQDCSSFLTEINPEGASLN